MRPLYDESISKSCDLLDQEIARLEKEKEELKNNYQKDLLKIWRESINKPISQPTKPNQTTPNQSCTHH